MGFDYARRILRHQPEVEEVFGAQELFADGAIFRDRPDAGMMTSIYYTERSCGHRTILSEQFRIHMPRQRWFANLDRTLAVLRMSVGGVH